MRAWKGIDRLVSVAVFSVVLAGTVLSACRVDESAAGSSSTPQTGDSPKAAAAALAHEGKRSAEEVAALCEHAMGRLTFDQRTRCWAAHLAVARAKLAGKNFSGA